MAKNTVNMTEGSIGGKLFQVALPLAATAVLQQMFNAADVAVVGRFAGKEAMAAVGSNTPVIGLMVNLFTGISLGTNVVIAKMIGAKDETRVRDAVHTSILLAILGGFLLMMVGQIRCSGCSLCRRKCCPRRCSISGSTPSVFR